MQAGGEAREPGHLVRKDTRSWKSLRWHHANAGPLAHQGSPNCPPALAAEQVEASVSRGRWGRQEETSP